jgi:hypothetical protein
MQEATSSWLQTAYPEAFNAVADVRTAMKLVGDNTSTVLREIQRAAGMPMMGEVKDTLASAAVPTDDPIARQAAGESAAA